MKSKLIAINKQNKETSFGFIGKYRTQTDTCISWKYSGTQLFEKIPCSKCGVKFSDKDLKNGNYELWTHTNFAWIDKKLNLSWDRHLINYRVLDKDNNCRDFKDGKQLVLKLGFVITDITHKSCN